VAASHPGTADGGGSPGAGQFHDDFPKKHLMTPEGGPEVLNIARCFEFRRKRVALTSEMF
jgi:hypothetical protein